MQLFKHTSRMQFNFPLQDIDIIINTPYYFSNNTAVEQYAALSVQ